MSDKANSPRPITLDAVTLGMTAVKFGLMRILLSGSPVLTNMSRQDLLNINVPEAVLANALLRQEYTLQVGETNGVRRLDDRNMVLLSSPVNRRQNRCKRFLYVLIRSHT